MRPNLSRPSYSLFELCNLILKSLFLLWQRFQVYVTEVYQNRLENLVAIGLRSSVAVIQLIYDDSTGAIGFELLHKVRVLVVKRGDFPTFFNNFSIKCNKNENCVSP